MVSTKYCVINTNSSVLFNPSRNTSQRFQVNKLALRVFMLATLLRVNWYNSVIFIVSAAI